MRIGPPRLMIHRSAIELITLLSHSSTDPLTLLSSSSELSSSLIRFEFSLPTVSRLRLCALPSKSSLLERGLPRSDIVSTGGFKSLIKLGLRSALKVFKTGKYKTIEVVMFRSAIGSSVHHPWVLQSQRLCTHQCMRDFIMLHLKVEVVIQHKWVG